MLTEIFKRLKAETPHFFRKLAGICVSIAVASVAALNFWGTLGFGEMPIYLQQFFHICGIAGTAGTFISMLTVKDRSAIK